MLDWTTPALAQGLSCYRHAQYFEAHEHWESVWLQAAEPEKTFLQGLIQLAGAFHHFRRGNRNGARSMAQKALARLDRYPDVFGGILVAHLRASVRAWLVALETELVELPAVPQLPFA